MMWISLAICYLTCLALAFGQTSNGKGNELDDTISGLCSEKSSMLKRGLSEKMASKIIEKRIEKLTGPMMRGFYPYYVQPLTVKRKSLVGSRGHSINLNVMGIQQSTITNQRAIALDQTNNKYKESDVTAFELNSQPTITTGRGMMGGRRQLTKNPVELKCVKQVRNQMKKALKRANHLDTKKFETRGSSGSKNDLQMEGSLRQSNSNSDSTLAKVAVKEKTAIGSGGYNIDFDQIGSGGSTNSLSNAIMDEQQHSNLKSSNVKSTLLTLTGDISL